MNAAVYSLFISLALRMTVVTVFVVLIKSVLREKLSAAAHCAIWVILLAQTVFCLGNISIPAKTSIYNVVPASNVVHAEAVPAAAAASQPDVRNIIALVYAIGIVIFAIWYIGIFLIHRIRVHKSETIADSETLAILSDVKHRLGIMNNIILKRGDYAHTLMNTVVLPDGYKEEEQQQILLHELCHYKHKDNIKLWASVAVICLNWFNPVIWLSFRRFRRDIEMYCDDSVLKLTENRKEYARVLVKTASEHIRFVPGVVGAANGTNEVAARVRRIAAWKQKKPVWLIVAMMASLCVSCLCLTDAVSIAVETTAVEITATQEPAAVAAAEPTVITPTPAATAPIHTNPPTAPPKKQQQTTAVSNPATVIPVQEATEEPVTVTERTEEKDNNPTVSANGSKETYSREDGKTVVLQYDGDNLQTGYIIDGDE